MAPPVTADWRDVTSEPLPTVLKSRIGMMWALGAVVVTGVLASARLLASPRFYFADDSEVGAFGQWWQLGDRLLSGRIPVLDPQAWQAGNYFAEGQWGLLNPVTWVIAVTARWSESTILHVTIVKIAFLMLMAGGAYLLARSFGARAEWSALAAVLVPMGGFTVYMDAPSWATGLFNAAVLPWVWWGLRRAVEDDRQPFTYLIASYVLITFGYVFGVLILVVILVESLVRALVERDRSRVMRTILSSAWGALLTVAVYLPGMLTAPVTERAGLSIINTWFLNADLSDMASVGAPTASASIGSWWGPVTNAPLVYVAWVLPLLPFALPMARDAVRRAIPLFVLAAVTLVAVIGPSQVGPIRWPVRFMPYLALAALILVAVMASRTFPDRMIRHPAAWSFVVLALTTGITYANTPAGRWHIGLIALIQAAAIGAAVLITRRRSEPSSWRGGPIAVAGAIAISGLVLIPQLVVYPATPLPKFGVPDSVERMRSVLPDSPGDGIVVGDIYAFGGVDASFDERLMGNLWYLSPTPVSSLYTVLPYTTFSHDLCMDLRGATCAAALDTLWSTDDETGLTVADLMGVSTILVIKQTVPDLPQSPSGWRLVDEGEYTWLFERGEAVPGAGGVAWTGAGTEVTAVEQSETSVSFRVDAVGDDPRVVLSRLDYPGYSIDGAAPADPVRDWLLTADVSAVRPGDVVTVSFRPPGFPIVAGAFVAAGLVLAGWLVLRMRSRRRADTVTSESDVLSAEPDTRD